MAYTTINKSTDNFNTKIYTGNNSSQTITGIGFQPDWVWFKSRTTTDSHYLVDSVRGNTKYLRSQTNTAEETNTTAVTSFNSDGYALGSAGNVNDNANYVAWNWLANGAGSSNTDGSITSNVSANTTAGFSIVSYTGNGTSGATVGHGLGSVPKVVIVKTKSGTGNWINYHSSLGNTKYLSLNQTNSAGTTSQAWNDTSPTNQVFSLGNSSEVNGNGTTMIAYCFAEKKGYSKFGSYTGNGSTDGTFVYTGFKPAWLMVKRTTVTGENWYIYDNTRPTFFNPNKSILIANQNLAEYNNFGDIDFLSNGFKIRTTNNSANDSGETYVYIAFGQSLVGSNNVPCTAR